MSDKRKILFIRPPIEDFYFTKDRMFPYGIMILISLLVKNNYQVDFIDFVSEKRKSIKVPDTFKKAYQFYNSINGNFKLFTQYYRFGNSDDEINDVLLSKNYNE